MKSGNELFGRVGSADSRVRASETLLKRADKLSALRLLRRARLASSSAFVDTYGRRFLTLFKGIQCFSMINFFAKRNKNGEWNRKGATRGKHSAGFQA